MNKKSICLIIAIFLLQPCVKADEYPDDECAPGGSGSSSTACLDLKASMDYEKADKDLNSAYKKVIAKLVPNAESSEDDKKYLHDLKKSFIEAQRQWIIFRDLECEAWNYLNPLGSGHYQMMMQCFEDRTRDRTKQLNQWLQEL